MIIATPLFAVILWLGVIGTIFAIKYEWIIAIPAIIFCDIIAMILLIIGSCEEKLYKCKKILIIIATIFTVSIIVSCSLLPAAKWHQATSYNNTIRNATGYSIAGRFVPNCYDAAFPCRLKCRYFISENNYQDLPQYNGTTCLLQPIMMCSDFIMFPINNCTAEIITCRAMWRSKIAIRETLGNCLAYFNAMGVHWGEIDTAITWPYILFASLSITGFVISGYLTIIAHCVLL